MTGAFADFGSPFARAAARHMIKQHSGVIIFVTGISIALRDVH
jgi:hypothetical protein